MGSFLGEAIDLRSKANFGSLESKGNNIYPIQGGKASVPPTAFGVRRVARQACVTSHDDDEEPGALALNTMSHSQIVISKSAITRLGWLFFKKERLNNPAILLESFF